MPSKDNMELMHACYCGAVFERITLTRRYIKLADWEYINQCASSAKGLQLIGNGDIMSYTDYNEHMRACPDLATTMLARGALIKPWLFTEVLPSASLPSLCAASQLCALQSCMYALSSKQPSVCRPPSGQC